MMHGRKNIKCKSVIICEIVVHLLVIVQNKKILILLLQYNSNYFCGLLKMYIISR